MTTERDRIQARAAADAQQLKTVRMDLDAFLALKGEARAARWRGLDQASKMDLVIQQFGRLAIDWTDELVAEQIAKYDTKWGAELLTSEQTVLAELARLAAEHGEFARTARAEGLKVAAKDFQRAANAYANAASDYAAGVRPEALPNGAWLLPSHRPGQSAHILTKAPYNEEHAGEWVCTCASGAAIHWASAMLIGIEVAGDAIDRDDVADEPSEEATAIHAAALGRRLAAARARMQEAA
jgi:hypothetical protein